MCNPRKILMHATEQLAKAWQAELRRTAQVGGTATGEARLVQPLAAMLAPAALRAFEQAVGADPGWIERSGAFYLAIPGGHACYRPDRGELEMTVQLSEDLIGTGTGRAVASGSVVGQASASAEGHYYTDGWNGLTRSRAEQEALTQARDQARAEAAARADFMAEQARRDALAGLGAEQAVAENEALLSAQADLDRKRAEREAQLSADAESGLEEVHRQTMQGVFRTVAAGLQYALLDYAAAQGATGVVVDESDDVIEIQFELEA